MEKSHPEEVPDKEMNSQILSQESQHPPQIQQQPTDNRETQMSSDQNQMQDQEQLPV